MAKRVAPLTAKQIQAAGSTRQLIELIDGAVPGLRLRIGPMGHHWSLAMRDNAGRMRRFAVGENLRLAEARLVALKLRQEVKAGADPVRDARRKRKLSKDAMAGRGTLRSIIVDYFAAGDGRGLSTKHDQQRLIFFVFANHLNDPALGLNPVDLQLTVDAHPSASSASRAVAYLRPIFRWAAKRGLLLKGFDEIEKPVEQNTRIGNSGILSEEMLRKILPVLTDGHGEAAKMMLWTGCRRSEVAGATWDEFDLTNGLWTIAATRRKDTRTRSRKNQHPTQPHIIPLPSQAVSSLIKLRRAHPTGKGLVFTNQSMGQLDNWDRWSKKIFKLSGTAGWSRHDLRRTCGTLAADLGTPPHVVSAILGHKNLEHNQLLGVYNKSRYRKEHGAALQQVADYLASLCTDSNVISMLEKSA